MSRTVTCLRIGIATLAALAFCLSLAPSLLLGDLSAVLFDSGRMTKLLADSLVHSGAVSSFAANLLSGEVAGQAQVASYLTPAERADVIRTLFPPSWQEEQIAANVDEAYAWLDSPDPLPHFSLSLAGIKADLQGKGGERLAGTLVDSWPACSPQQLQAFASGALTQGALPVCQPPEPYLAALKQGVGQEVNQVASQLPDSLDWGQAAAAGSATAVIKADLRILRGLGPVAWLLPLFLLLLALALAARSVRGLLAWTGIPLGVASLIGVLCALLVRAWGGRQLVAGAGLPDALGSAATSFLGALLGSVCGRLLIECAVLLFLGFVLALSSALIRPRGQPGLASAPSGSEPSSAGIRAAEPRSPTGQSPAAASGGTTPILPKSSSADDSSGKRPPPRGMFG